MAHILGGPPAFKTVTGRLGVSPGLLAISLRAVLGAALEAIWGLRAGLRRAHRSHTGAGPQHPPASSSQWGLIIHLEISSDFGPTDALIRYSVQRGY